MRISVGGHKPVYNESFQSPLNETEPMLLMVQALFSAGKPSNVLYFVLWCKAWQFLLFSVPKGSI